MATRMLAALKGGVQAPASRDTRVVAGTVAVTESGVHTFLIADIRGYTRFTHERGDDAATRLAMLCAAVTKEVVTAHDGTVVELRGDEALVAFASARQSASHRGRAPYALRHDDHGRPVFAPHLRDRVGHRGGRPLAPPVEP